MSKKQFLAEHDSHDIAELFAFENIEPFGDEWRQAGLIAALIHNQHAKRGKQVEDFMPIVRRRKMIDLASVIGWFTPKKPNPE